MLRPYGAASRESSPVAADSSKRLTLPESMVYLDVLSASGCRPGRAIRRKEDVACRHTDIEAIAYASLGLRVPRAPVLSWSSWWKEGLGSRRGQAATDPGPAAPGFFVASYGPAVPI